MKTQSKSIARRESVITLDVESRKLSLKLIISNSDGKVDCFEQLFNLDVMPYEMAMSVICSLINPQRNGSK